MQAADGSDLDCFVDLVNARGIQIAQNDDAHDQTLRPTDAQIKRYRLLADGAYTIRATRFGRETTHEIGAYTLTLTLSKPSGFLTPTITDTPSPVISNTPIPPTNTPTPVLPTNSPVPTNTATPITPTSTRTPTFTPSTAPWRLTLRAFQTATAQTATAVKAASVSPTTALSDTPASTATLTPTAAVTQTSTVTPTATESGF
jgi:hypothetical protein